MASHYQNISTKTHVNSRVHTFLSIRLCLRAVMPIPFSHEHTALANRSNSIASVPLRCPFEIAASFLSLVLRNSHPWDSSAHLPLLKTAAVAADNTLTDSSPKPPSRDVRTGRSRKANLWSQALDHVEEFPPQDPRLHVQELTLKKQPQGWSYHRS
jgi:hypothetical protein